MTNAETPLGPWEKPEIYRAYSPDGTLLYVGSTRCYPIRVEKHKEHASWWSSDLFWLHEAYPTMTEVRAAERAAIKAEHPLMNSRGRTDGDHAPATVDVSILQAVADEDERRFQADLDLIAEAVTR